MPSATTFVPKIAPKSIDIKQHADWAAQQIRRRGLPLPDDNDSKSAIGGAQAAALGDAHGNKGNWTLAVDCYEMALLISLVMLGYRVNSSRPISKMVVST